MILGLYAAANGMRSVEERQAVIANNISNASSPGFRRQQSVQEGFYHMFSEAARNPRHLSRLNGPGGGPLHVETFTDASPGTLINTGDALDMAIVGPGFIAVDTPAGERFSRSGKLTIDADGQLATWDGWKVQNVDGGGIDASGGSLAIDKDGIVTVDGVPTGRMRMVEFADIHALSRVGGVLFSAPDAALDTAVEATETEIVHEALEGSNVKLPGETIQLMMGVREYEANQRVLNAIDHTMDSLIQRVGTPS